MKYKLNTLVKVYKDTPTYIDGEMGKIIDRDPNDGSYAFASLGDIYKHKDDILSHIKWVSEANITPITFEKPIPPPTPTFLEKNGVIIGSFILGTIIGACGLYGYFLHG